MASSEVAQLTKECLEALRLGGPPGSDRELLEVPADSSDRLKIVGIDRVSVDSPEPDEGDKKRDGENARHVLGKLKFLVEFLPMRGAPKEFYGTRGTKIVKNGAPVAPELLKKRKEFCRDGYWSVLNQLVDSFDSPWFETLNKKQRKRFIDPFFLEGFPSFVLLLFCERMKQLPQGVRLSRLMAMLEKFFTSDSYRNIFFQHAFAEHEAIEAELLRSVREKILVAVASFPSIAANKLKEQTPKYLSLKSYYTFVVLQLTLCISEIMLEKEYSQRPLPPSVPVFLGAVVGKLCLTSGGFGDQILVQLLSSNGATCLEYDDWRRLFNDIFRHVPDACMEVTLTPLMRHCAHSDGVISILGPDFLRHRPKAVFLLTSKMLLSRRFADPTILQNIFGYLSVVSENDAEFREKIFGQTISQLLDYWGSEATVSYTSAEQHEYLTKAIICGVARMTTDDVRRHGENFMTKLLTGMSPHLSSPSLVFRELGMITAEIIVGVLRADAGNVSAKAYGDKLEFEHSNDAQIARLAENLKKLSRPPALPTMMISGKVVPISIFPKWDSNLNACITNMPSRVDQLTADELVEAAKNFKLTDDSLATMTEQMKNENENTSETTKSITNNAGHSGLVKWSGEGPREELDSDDDLEPYDTPLQRRSDGGSTKAPKYIQECLEGLLSSHDDRDPSANRVELCLKQCEKLIREAQRDTMEEVGVELARVLLHLADQFGAYNYDFEELRLNALIACVVRAPKEVATYLTGEFYERNYSIRQRMDILEVLSNGAQELANFPPSESTKRPRQSRSMVNGATWANGDDHDSARKDAELTTTSEADSSEAEASSSDWKSVVQRRIDAKTRVISKGKTKAELERVANQFGSVAGYFFFPLLKMLDQPSANLYLLDKNYLLLGRLLYCLGVILYSAVNTPVCPKMARTLLEVVWCIRSHSQTYVRLSLIYALSIIAITVPPAVLVAEFQSELVDFRTWLEELRSNDPEPEVQRQANQTISLLVAALAQGIHPPT